LSDYWSDNIPVDPKKPKKITSRPRAKEVLSSSKVAEWTRKYSESEKGKEFLKKINDARAAIYKEYTDKVNSERSSSVALGSTQIAQAQDTGLLFGIAGMYGNAFPPRKLSLVPGQGRNVAINKLKGPVDVSLVGGVLAKDKIEKQIRLNAQTQAQPDKLLDFQLAPTSDELSDKFGVKSSLTAIKKANKDRALQYVTAIAQSLDPSSGGSQIFLDFDRTLAFGADKLTRVSSKGIPDYSAFGDTDEVRRGLSGATLSQLGKRLKNLVKNAETQQTGLGTELLRRMFVVSARPSEGLSPIIEWVQSQGLGIPSSNFVGVGGSGKSPDDVAIAKAENILQRLSGDRSVFIDDDLRNVDTARAQGLRAFQYGANIDSKAIKDAQDREGTSFEKFVRENLPPNLVNAMVSSQKGESIDYPQGLGDLASTWFNEPLLASIPTDVKRTISGKSKAQSNIANFLRKNFGYFAGGKIQNFASGGGIGGVPAMVSNGEAYIPPQLAKRIGYAKLDRMNQSDRNGMKGFASGGISKFEGPGSGTSDSIGPINLPVGSYILREKATKALGFNKGGSVGRVQKFAAGSTGGVRIAEDRRLAGLFAGIATNIRDAGMTAENAFDRAAEEARTAFPEAARLLADAAESFRSGADPSAIFAPFGGELARLAGDAFSSRSLPVDQFNELANIVNKSADTLDLFSLEAGAAGSSLETFEQNLKKQLAERTLNRESSRRSQRIDLTREIIRGRSADFSTPENVAEVFEKLAPTLNSLLSSLEGVDPSQIDATLQSLVQGLAAGQNLQELRSSIPLLNDAFDQARDRAAALAEVEAEAAASLGGLSSAVRNTVEELDAIDYKQSGEARRDFGALGEVNPAAALRFRNSRVGGALLRGSRGFQENLGLGNVPVVGQALGGLNKVLGQLPGPIGNAVRAIGGLPGALAATASIIGSELIPQINKLIGVSEDPTAAGIAGGVTQAGSLGVSLGTVGQQVGGVIGGVVGVIGGSIAGFIKGFAESFRQQELTNALKGLSTAAENTKKALDNLSKYDSAENAQAVQKAAIDAEIAGRELERISQRTTGERATDAISYAVIGTTISAVLLSALAPFTGGLSLLGTAAVLGVGATAGAAYGASQDFSDIDNEALNAYLENITSINETFTVLAERDIKFKSLEDLNSIINDFQDSSGAIDTAALGRQSEYIRQAQEGALRAQGFTISSTENLEAQLNRLGPAARELATVAAEQAAYNAGLEELSRQLKGNIPAIRAATDTPEEREALTRRGFERIGEERRQLALQQRLALIARQVNLETEKLSDVYDKLLSSLQRYNDALNETDIAIANSTDILLNQSRLAPTSRSDIQVLRNARAYSDTELDRVLSRVEDLAGGGERSRALTDVVRGRRIVEDELPQLLRNVTQRNISDVSASISELFSKAGLGREVTDALITEIETTLELETGGRQGKSFNELVQQFGSLQKAMDSMEKANETAIALLEAQSNLYDKITERLNAYSDALQKSTEWSIKASTIRLQSENELAKALGKGVSLDNLNRVLNQEILSLTENLEKGFQGTTNPAEIAARIRENQRVFEQTQNQIRQEPSTPQGRKTVGELLKEQAKLKTSSANLFQALEKLANSTDNASNALNTIQERRQIGENAADLLEKVFTQGAEEADRMFRSFGAFQDALRGNLLFTNQNERVLAFEGLRNILPLLGNEIGAQVRAAFLEQMLRGNNIDLRDELIPGIAGQGRFTFEDVLNNLRNPEADPATKALIDSYLSANQLMREAAIEISRLNAEAAQKFLGATDRLLQIPLPGLDQVNNNNDQMAADIRAFTAAALAQGSIFTHDVTTERLLNDILQNNSVTAGSSPIIGANNLDNINLPVFEKIATSIPTLNTELLNVVKTLETFNIRLSDFIETFRSGGSDINNKSGLTTAIEGFNSKIDGFISVMKDFGTYINQLQNIKFPDKITMGGSYTVDVRVSGAAAFQSIEERVKTLIDTEIGKELDGLVERIARSTGYRVDPRRREP